jgi:phosphatidylglycerol:prolipoprotein diacylglycerol transferase
MKVLFNFFGIPIYFFGVMIAFGLIAGILISYQELKRKKLEANRVLDLATYGIVSAIIGARIFYIIFYNPSLYLKNPIEIIMISEGGLSIHGGLIGAFLFGIYYFRKHKLSFLQYADAIAPGIILGQGIGRVGCDVFGKVMNSTLPWGILRNGQLVHPTQIYEFLLNYAVFYILWRKRKNIKYNGQLFVWYLILFGINRSIVELFRYNPSIIGWFSISHLLSIGLILVSIIIKTLIMTNRNTVHLSADKKNAVNLEDKSREWLKDLLFVIILIVISLLIFYRVQT